LAVLGVPAAEMLADSAQKRVVHMSGAHQLGGAAMLVVAALPANK
jgi:hypothetical protein